MWPFHLFQKISRDPGLGETRGDYIGCYLLGAITPGEETADYHSLALSLPELLSDTRELLDGFLRDRPHAPPEQTAAVTALRDALEARVQAHLALPKEQMQAQPLLEIDGRHLFLRIGMRARKKLNGQYLE